MRSWNRTVTSLSSGLARPIRAETNSTYHVETVKNSRKVSIRHEKKNNGRSINWWRHVRILTPLAVEIDIPP
jgi:hypothetical protein